MSCENVILLPYKAGPPSSFHWQVDSMTGLHRLEAAWASGWIDGASTLLRGWRSRLGIGN